MAKAKQQPKRGMSANAGSEPIPAGATRKAMEELGRRMPDTSALRELTGWTPSRTVDDAIDDVIAYERRPREAPPRQALVRLAG